MRCVVQQKLLKRTADGIRHLDSILLILALFILAVAVMGFATLVVQHTASAAQEALGCAALLATTELLWLTVERWSKWLTGLAFLAALKTLPAFITGTYWSGPHARDPASRVWFAGAVASFVVLAFLCIRFRRRRPKTDEKVVLVFFVLVTIIALPMDRVRVAAWTVSLAALLLIWLKGTLSSTLRRRSSGPPDLSIAPRRQPGTSSTTPPR